MPAMKPKVREDLAVVELDGEAVIYDDRNGELHHLNPTATVVFSLLDGTATVKELAGDISEAFGVPADQVETQVRALIREFRKAELLDGLPLAKPSEALQDTEEKLPKVRARARKRPRREQRSPGKGRKRKSRRMRAVHG